MLALNAGLDQLKRFYSGALIIEASFYTAIGISFFEFFTMFAAFLRKKTHSYKRLIMRFSIFSLMTMLYWQYRIWNEYILALEPFAGSGIFIADTELDMENTPFIISICTAAIVFIFLYQEIKNLLIARRNGRTRNISRLFTSVAILFCILPIFTGIMNIWKNYAAKMEERYQNDNQSAKVQRTAKREKLENQTPGIP